MKLREEITSLSFFSIVPKANFTTLLKVVKKIFYKVTAEGEDDRITISIPETQELLTYRDDDFSTFQLACTKLLQQYYRKRNLFSRTLIVQQGKEYLFEVHFLSKTKKIIIKIYDQAFKDQTEMDESVAKEHYINEISRKSSFHNISSLNPNKNKYELVRLLKINFSDIYLEDKNLSKLDKYKIADFILERKIIFQFKTFMIGTITEAEINEILQEEHPKLAEWVKQTIKEVSGILPAEKTSELYNELVKPLPPVKGMKALKIFQQKALSRVSRKYPSKSGSQSSALPSPKVQAPKKPFTLKNFNPKTGRRKGLRPIGYKLPIRRLDSDQSHSKGDLISDMGDQSPPGIVYSSAGYLQQSKRRIEREEEELEQQMKLERERSSSGEIQIIDQGENVKLLSDIKLAFGIQEHDFENEDSDEEIKESTPVARKSSFENEVIQPDNPMDLLSPIQASRFSQGRAASSRRSGIEANGGNKIEFLIDSKRESLDNQEGNEDIELEPPRAHFGFKVQHTSTEPVKSLMSDIKNIRNTLQVKDRLAKIVDDSHVGTTSRRERDFKIGSRHNSRIVRGTSRTNSRLSNDSIKKDHSQNSNRPLANKSIIQVKKMELDPEITSKQSKDLSRSKLDEPSIKAPPSIRASLSRTKMEMKSNTALEPQPTELNPPTKRSFDRADLNSPSEAPEEPQTDQQLVRLNAQSARVDESPFKGKKHRSVINVIIQSPHPSESFNPADSPAVHARSGLLAPKRKLSSHIDSIASPQVKKDTRDNKSVRETSRQSNRNLATSTPASKPFSFAANRSPLGVRIDHKSPTLQVTNVTLGKSRSTSATKMADRKKNFLKEVEKNDRAGLKITTPLEIKPRKVTQNSSTPPSATAPAKIERIIINPPMENSQNSASQPPNFFQPLKKMRLKDKSDKE
jgi:hypothetical protein